MAGSCHSPRIVHPSQLASLLLLHLHLPMSLVWMLPLDLPVTCAACERTAAPLFYLPAQLGSLANRGAGSSPCLSEALQSHAQCLQEPRGTGILLLPLPLCRSASPRLHAETAPSRVGPSCDHMLLLEQLTQSGVHQLAPPEWPRSSQLLPAEASHQYGAPAARLEAAGDEG